MSESVIRVADVTKVYKLYARNRDRMTDALGLSRQKRYQEHYALKHVSFSIDRGETVGIIGVNGAGKSTILKIITGILSPTEGTIEADGRISALLELGAGFNMEYTGIENIYLNGTMMGYTKEEIDGKLQSILDFADIGEFVHQPVKTYSSGMFVRLAFALAINIDPEILVVDEALSVGDVFFQAKCYQKFEDFKKEGKTILFVSHDLSSISKYCDRVILLNHGEKMAEGSPKEMVDLYKKILAGTEEERKAEEQKHRVAELEAGEDPATAPGKGADRVSDNGAGSAPDPHAAMHALMESDTHGTDWKRHFTVNPLVSSYGDRRAEIVDFAVEDASGGLTGTIVKGEVFTIRYRVWFREEVKDPIFTFTLKTVRGTDVSGTNTMLEKRLVEKAGPEELYEVSFRQKMTLQGGEYLLSISCTGYENGELKAHHRLYDVLDITVVSDKNTVGFFDMESETEVTPICKDTH